MTIEDCIKLRNELKCGKNIPLRILIDNCFTIIDESHRLQFTKWDDASGTLYSLRLIDPQSDHIGSNKEDAISVFAVPYEHIQAMEIPVLRRKDLDSFFDSLASGGCTFSEDYKNLIKNTFKEALNPDMASLSPTKMKQLLGSDAADNRDDYYNGKYTEAAKDIKYRNYDIEEKRGKG